MSKPVIFRYGRDGVQKGAYNYAEGRHEESIDGVDRLVLASHSKVAKGDRMVWRDSGGTWHEHVVSEFRREHESGDPVVESTCINSVCELFGLECPGTVVKGSAKKILKAILDGTRWQVGKVDVEGTFEVELFHKSRREALTSLVEATMGEMSAYVAVGEAGVESRHVSLLEKRGSRNVRRQFKYGRNVSRATREVGATDPVTQVVAYGETKRNIELERRREIDDKRRAKGQEAMNWPELPDATDYDERISVTVQDDSLVARWGTPQANGRLGHTTYVYTDSGCTSLTYLEKEAKRVLRNMKTPDASYEFSISDIDHGTRLHLGDSVSVLDDDMGLLDEMRVYSITRHLGERTDGVVRIGKRPDLLVETFKAVEKESRATSGNSSKAAASTPSRSGGSYVSGGSGYSGYSGGSAIAGGDGIRHLLDGVEIAPGSTISFTTVAAPEVDPTAPGTWGEGGTDASDWTDDGSGSGWDNSADGGWGGTGGGGF